MILLNENVPGPLYVVIIRTARHFAFVISALHVNFRELHLHFNVKIRSVGFQPRSRIMKRHELGIIVITV